MRKGSFIIENLENWPCRNKPTILIICCFKHSFDKYQKQVAFCLIFPTSLCFLENNLCLIISYFEASCVFFFGVLLSCSVVDDCRCDRILWKGEGMKQMWYVRGESKFSDHRPVYSLFAVQIDLLANKNKHKKPMPTITHNNNNTATTRSCLLKASSNTALPASCVAKVQAEELLLLTRAQSCIDSRSRFWFQWLTITDTCILFYE